MTHFAERAALGAALFVAVVLGAAVFVLMQALQRIRLAREITENENTALAIRYALFLLALVISFTQVIEPADGVGDNLLTVVKYGPPIVAVLAVAYFVNAIVMLHTIANNEEVVGRGNVAVAIVEGATFIATAFITAATLVGLETNLAEALIWLAIGQVGLVLLTYLYHRLVPETYDALKKDNVACALSLGCLQVAMGLTLAAVISGPSTTWWKDLGGAALYLLGWAALMAAAYVLANRMLVRGARLRSEVMARDNVAAGLLEGCVFLGVTLLYTLVIR
jgi:uncharacterized membrane protein YjfL (UPF0719 family)